MNKRLQREIQLLYHCEFTHKLPAAPIIRQLIEDEARPLPDILPPLPQLVRFEWPRSSGVDFVSYWRELDRNLAPNQPR